jgi:D-alanine-D-alanine ligase
MISDLSKMRIVVLCGGTSSERVISLQSGKAVFEGLLSLGYRVTLVDVQKGFHADKLPEGTDFVFIALHGKYGEDGSLQSQLEELKIPYSGSRALGCRQAFDKKISRDLFDRGGLAIPEGRVWGPQTRIKEPPFDFPLFIKPARGGSSIGVSLVRAPGQFNSSLKRAFKEDSEIIVEKKVVGRELTVGILGEEALPPLEIKTKGSFFDFDSKYISTETCYEEVEDLSRTESKHLQHLAFQAHQLVGCSVFSRVDFILSPQGAVILEVNAIPGLTNKSLLPKMARFQGISFDQLCVRIIRSSLKLTEIYL